MARLSDCASRPNIFKMRVPVCRPTLNTPRRRDDTKMGCASEQNGPESQPCWFEWFCQRSTGP
eukprot:4437700-Lingulodinium_polyedra.AAC.1